ncbi:TPA: amino acid ABC transporter permease [Candidatus Bipolaricaulota bacterium]|nr:amino acid ABC transporter permease [Candidatus Bipolaricaulota bacterium]
MIIVLGAVIALALFLWWEELSPFWRDLREGLTRWWQRDLIIVIRGLPGLFKASLLNIALLFGLITLGFMAGIPIALLQVYGNRVLGGLASLWEWFFRGVPELVLLFLFFFGSAQFGLEMSPFTAAMLALGCRSSGYQSQIFRGAIQAIPKGQALAAHSIGLSRVQAIRHVILPQALRLAIPPWSNEFSSVIKDTTLAYAIGVNEITRYARFITERHYRLAMLVYLAVALIFLLFTYLGNRLLGFLEHSLAVPGFETKAARARAAVGEHG